MKLTRLVLLSALLTSCSVTTDYVRPDIAGDDDGPPVAGSWAKHVSGTGPQHVQSVAQTADGGVVAAGWYGGTIDLGGGPLDGSGSTQYIFLAKFNAAGEHQWSRRFGNGQAGSGYKIGIRVLPSGDLLMAGNYTTTISFGATTLNAALHQV